MNLKTHQPHKNNKRRMRALRVRVEVQGEVMKVRILEAAVVVMVKKKCRNKDRRTWLECMAGLFVSFVLDSVDD